MISRYQYSRYSLHNLHNLVQNTKHCLVNLLRLKAESKMIESNSTMVGLDLSNFVFQVAVVNHDGEVVTESKLKREEMRKYFGNLKPTVVAMEARVNAHYWGRELLRLGHEVRLLPAKAFVRNKKRIHIDAVAVAEAAYQPGQIFVPIKNEREQRNWQYLRELHRARESIKKDRSQTRGFVRSILAKSDIMIYDDFGMIDEYYDFDFIEESEDILIPSDLVLSEPLRTQLKVYREDLDKLNQSMTELDKQIDKLAVKNEAITRLTGVVGINKLSASALVCAIGDGQSFRQGRELAAWMGLTPRHHSNSDKNHNPGNFKKGNIYLRKLFIRGGYSVVMVCDEHMDTDKVCRKAYRLLERGKSYNEVAVAVAATLVRISWAMLVSGEKYNPKKV